MKAGIILLILGGTLLGLCGAGRLSDRTDATEQAIVALHALKREICTRLAPLQEAVAEACQGTDSRLLSRFSAELSRRGSAAGSECWRLAVNSAGLSEKAIQMLNSLAPIIGRYEGEEQRQAFDRTAEQLTHLVAEQREKSRMYGKIYLACGICGSTIAAILLW